MSNTPKLIMIISGIALLGILIYVFGVERESMETELSSALSGSDIERLHSGCDQSLPKPESNDEYNVTVYGASGAIGNRDFSPTDFARFSIPVPCYTKYVSNLSIDDLRALLRPDGIPSIDTPRYESVSEADNWLLDEDIVMTIIHGDLVRAYPTRILNWHEIVNDTFEGTPVTITFCPLCNSGLIFVRPEIDGQRPEFGTSGRIYKSDLVMYDRATLSLWSQVEGGPIVGSLVGELESLEQLPAGLTQWGFWKEAHPETEVLARPTTDLRIGGFPPTAAEGQGRLYDRNYNINPYQAYLTDNGDTFGTGFSDRRLPAKADVVGIRIGDALAKAYLKESVEKARIINDMLGGLNILVLWDQQSQDVLFYNRELDGSILEFSINANGEIFDSSTNSTWSFSGSALTGPFSDSSSQLEPIVGTTTFWFAWFNFHPHTELYADS